MGVLLHVRHRAESSLDISQSEILNPQLVAKGFFPHSPKYYSEWPYYFAISPPLGS
jgi:hypothetical protein